MRTKVWIVCGLVLLSAELAHAGSISGTIRAHGKDGSEIAESSGKYASRKFKFAERIDYSELRDFVVYIDQPLGTNAIPDKPLQVVTTRKISQKGAVFSPHVLPVVVGTTVEWPNYDEIFHNVFSISEAKQFDLGLYKQPEIKRVLFDKPGRVDVFCSIHKSMNCIVLVLENPFFAVADDQGRYRITNLPAGTYRLKSWHERLPSLNKEVTVPEQGEVRLDLTLGIENLPKY